jgi:hypothetical protein
MGYAMPADELKHFIYKIALRSSREKEWNRTWRESLGTQMLGVLSVALGLVAVMKIPVIWFGFSCVGQSIDAWLNPASLSRHLSSSQTVVTVSCHYLLPPMPPSAGPIA